MLDRGIFLRIAFACHGYRTPSSKEKKLFSNKRIDFVLNEKTNFRKYYFGCLCYSDLINWHEDADVGKALSSGLFAVIAVCALHYDENLRDEHLKDRAEATVKMILKRWKSFEEWAASLFHNQYYFCYSFYYRNKSYQLASNYHKYYRSENLAIDLNDYFNGGSQLLIESKSRKKIVTLQQFLERQYLNADLIRRIEPLINPNNWWDEPNRENIARQLSIDIQLVNRAIKLITSKEHGYFIQKLYNQ